MTPAEAEQAVLAFYGYAREARGIPETDHARGPEAVRVPRRAFPAGREGLAGA
jgi:hypothetical protein